MAKMIWTKLEYGYCEAPRHEGQEIPAGYRMALQEEGQEMLFQSCCVECMDEMARDLGYDNAEVAANKVRRG